MNFALVILAVTILSAIIPAGICEEASQGLNYSITNNYTSINTTTNIPANETGLNNTEIASFNATPKDRLVAFVNNAAIYAKSGRSRAIKEFNNMTGPFMKNGLYILAYDFQGNVLADPYRPKAVNKNGIAVKDANGVYFIENEINVAKRGSGFSYYVSPNPAHGGKEELKLVYVRAIDGGWWIGSSIYLSDIPSKFSPDSRKALVDFVNQALEYAKKNGNDSALRAFNDPASNFTNGDRYIFAYDFNGTTLALPYQPELLGKNRADAKDPNGVEFVQDSIALSMSGGGFTYYIYPDPEMNMTERLKLSCIVKVDDSWFLGSGIYAS